MIEKLENCPDCNKALDQAEYDGQYCRACGTEPFGFQKAEKRTRTILLNPLLVDDIEDRLASAKHRAGRYSDDPRGWHARHRAEMEQLANRLTSDFDAKISDKWNGARVRIGGVTASSTSGIAGALDNWLRAARSRLEKTA